MAGAEPAGPAAESTALATSGAHAPEPELVAAER
jgi:hypothetical protein